jgi:hypothetical protein
MLKFLADENFNNDIVRAVLLCQPPCDLQRVQDVGLSGVDDDNLLAWAAAQDRIVVTHDRATMPDVAYKRIVAGVAMPGIDAVNDRAPLRQSIDELILIASCGDSADFANRVLYLPL